MDASGEAEVRDALRHINAAWLEGRPDDLRPLFHDRMVIVDGEGRRLGMGAEAAVESYRQFVTQATITRFDADEPSVDVFESTAVADSAFRIEYSIGGETYRDKGREVFVLAREGGRWLAVWRQLTGQPE